MVDKVELTTTAFFGFIMAIIVFTLSGTIIWLIWPVAIPAAFPTLVATGVLAAKLSWWQSVCLNWAIGLLIRRGASPTSKK